MIYTKLKIILSIYDLSIYLCEAILTPHLWRHARLCFSCFPFSGHLKFWKKKAVGIEFAKHFRSHLGPIEGLAVSFPLSPPQITQCLWTQNFCLIERI